MLVVYILKYFFSVDLRLPNASSPRQPSQHMPQGFLRMWCFITKGVMPGMAADFQDCATAYQPSVCSVLILFVCVYVCGPSYLENYSIMLDDYRMLGIWYHQSSRQKATIFFTWIFGSGLWWTRLYQFFPHKMGLIITMQL